MLGGEADGDSAPHDPAPRRPDGGPGVSAARIRLGRRLPRRVDGLLPAARHDALPRGLRARHGALVVVGRVVPRRRRLLRAGDPAGRSSRVSASRSMLLASRMPERFWMRDRAGRCSSSSCALQLLVVATPLGIEVGGNTNWLAIGPVQFQPSELIKVALVIWLGAHRHARSRRCSATCEARHPADRPRRRRRDRTRAARRRPRHRHDHGRDAPRRAVLHRGAAATAAAAGARRRRRCSSIVAVSSDSRMRRISAFLDANCDGAPATRSTTAGRSSTARSPSPTAASSASASATRRRSGRGSPRPTTTSSSRSSARNSASSAPSS